MRRSRGVRLWGRVPRARRLPWAIVRLAVLIVRSVEGNGWGVTYVPATVSGALVQDWAEAADGKVSGVTKMKLTARVRAVEIDRLGTIIVLGVSGRSDQGGRIRHEKWGNGKSFVELLPGVVILESETRHVPSQQALHPHSVLALGSSYAGSRQASRSASEMRFSIPVPDCLGSQILPEAADPVQNVEAFSRWLEAVILSCWRSSWP